MRSLILICLILGTITLSAQNVSIPKAVLMTAVLPGSGHIYIHQNTKAGFYLGTELGIVFSYFRMKSEKKWAENSYQKFAYSQLGLPLHSSSDKYTIIQKYYSCDEYNTSVKQYARDHYLIFEQDTEAYYEFLDENLIPPDESWQWSSKNTWSKYRNLRYKKQDYEIYLNFALGAAVLNRLISIVDVSVSSRKLKRSLRNLSINPDFINNGVQVCYEIKF